MSELCWLLLGWYARQRRSSGASWAECGGCGAPARTSACSAPGRSSEGISNSQARTALPPDPPGYDPQQPASLVADSALGKSQPPRKGGYGGGGGGTTVGGDDDAGQQGAGRDFGDGLVSRPISSDCMGAPQRTHGPRKGAHGLCTISSNHRSRPLACMHAPNLSMQTHACMLSAEGRLLPHVRVARGAHRGAAGRAAVVRRVAQEEEGRRGEVGGGGGAGGEENE